MPSTVDYRPTSSKGAWQDYGKAFKLSTTINFDTAANNLAQSETMALFDVPANTLVEFAAFHVITAVTGVTDVDLGLSTTGATNADLIDGADVSSTGYKQNATFFPDYVSAATQVVLTNKDADAMADGVIEVILICRDIA